MIERMMLKEMIVEGVSDGRGIGLDWIAVVYIILCGDSSRQ
jgi:hypothetical protein